jgi:hypothetical protein
MFYRRTQFGIVTAGIPLVVTSGVSIMLMAQGATAAGLLVLAIVLATTLIFGALTVSVEDHRLRVVYGIGLIHKTIDLRDVVAVRAVRTPAWSGWGIRLLPGGWLYNVQGRDAIELTRRSSGHVYVGTDDPEGLVAAIQALGVPPVAAETQVPGHSVGIMRWLPALLLLGPVIIISAIILAGLREPEVRVTTNAVTVHHGQTVLSMPRPGLQVTLLETLPEMQRSRGFRVTDVWRGRFRLADGSSVDVFVDRSVPPFIRFVDRDRVVFLGFGEAARTRELFESLR